MNKLFLILPLLTFTCTSCSTIVHQDFQEVSISSSPEHAQIVVDDTDYGVTPSVIRLTHKDSHKIIVTKEGYHSQTYNIESKVAPEKLAKNLVFPVGGLLVGGLTGLALFGSLTGPIGGAIGVVLIGIAGCIGLATGTITGLVGAGVDIQTKEAHSLVTDKLHAELEAEKND